MKLESTPPPATLGSKTETRAKMKRMHLKESQNTVASLTTLYEIDMMRARFEDQILKGHNAKLEFMSVFARVSVLALQDIPAVRRAPRVTRSSIAIMSI